MSYPINGFQDIHTLLTNERKIGGAIEAEQIKLRSGEVYNYPVFTNVDYTGGTFYSVGFVSDDGTRMIVNVSDISSIKSPMHKKVTTVQNSFFKEYKTREKLNYLKRLIRADQGAYTKPFVQEASLIVEDIGIKYVSNEINIEFLTNSKVVKIA